ncbi:hypothetical protein AMTR_s00104p00152930 [Amborella trichopoda]|uniref:FBD domain-containing protein n=1 Tax=Amborella trichopoda TaxID=13333 RepID=W1P0D3_AMBTC|nr:hypothetical protein AMTR_s00104p00152930 [Amborella trichopoda]
MFFQNIKKVKVSNKRQGTTPKFHDQTLYSCSISSHCEPSSLCPALNLLKFSCSFCKNLDLIDITSLERIPHWVLLSGLRNLEVLNTNNSGVHWHWHWHEEEEETGNGEESRVSLSSLSICFKDAILSDWFKPLASIITDLSLKNCIIKDVALIALTQDSRCIKFLCIDYCKQLQRLIIAEHAREDAFQCLTKLGLSGLPSLETICIGIPPKSCFGNVREITCPMLKIRLTTGINCSTI